MNKMQPALAFSGQVAYRATAAAVAGKLSSCTWCCLNVSSVGGRSDNVFDNTTFRLFLPNSNNVHLSLFGHCFCAKLINSKGLFVAHVTIPYHSALVFIFRTKDFDKESFGVFKLIMPQGPATNPFMKPFVVLALPGMYLFYKYNQYRRRKKENAKRRLTERELQHLNNKIDKLLNKLEESEPELAACPEEECVICINAKATMQTAPCGHQVVCRKCFVKTIQIAVSQRLLPLRCVICRAKILRLKTGPALPTSASGYSVNSRTSSVPQSDSLYSVSSGGSSISSSSCASDSSGSCCGGHCLGAYPRQPSNSALRRSQQHAMKIKLQEYCHPERSNINRLPPIKELPYSGSPIHTTAPASTRIRCAQKIVTQLETVPLLGKKQRDYKYEKLPQVDDTEKNDEKEKCKGWWSEKRWKERSKSEERIDNKKNEIMEKQMEMREKQRKIRFSFDTVSDLKEDTKKYK